jgi:hypothetical protein
MDSNWLSCAIGSDVMLMLIIKVKFKSCLLFQKSVVWELKSTLSRFGKISSKKGGSRPA